MLSEDEACANSGGVLTVTWGALPLKNILGTGTQSCIYMWPAQVQGR